MTLFFNSYTDAYLGFAAIFACLGFGFLSLRRAASGECGPGYWSASFFLNGAGFLLWSGVIPITPLRFYFLGEVLHILGFLALVCGAYRFTGNEYRRWNLYALLGWTVAWIGSLALISFSLYFAAFLLKGLRSVLFLWAGQMLLAHLPSKALAGRKLAGWSLLAWGTYILAFAFIRLPLNSAVNHLSYGFLMGFHIMAALGMVVMVVDRLRLRAEESEHRAERLEGLLPVCAYCKKIRDDAGAWQSMEAYISRRSSAAFSHGICPDCVKKHFPEFEDDDEESTKKP